MDTAGRYVVAALLVVLATVEFLGRLVLVTILCCSLIGLVMLLDDGHSLARVLEPASLGLIKSLAVTPPGQLTNKQRRELEFQRQHNAGLEETLRLEKALNITHSRLGL